MQHATSGEVLDCHFHTWDRPFPHRPFPWTPDPYPLSAILGEMDAAGVGRGVQITPIMYGFDNGYGAEAATASGGRISVFGRFDALAPEPERRLREWMATAGAAGVRLTYYGAALGELDDEARLEPFWAAAERLAVPVAVFAPDRMWAIVRAVERHPRLRLIVDHMGLGVYPGCETPLSGFPVLRELAPFEQILVKVSGAPEVSRDPYPFADMHDLIAETCERFGADRLMWGSNFPVVLSKCGYGDTLAFFAALDFLGADERARILGGTCARLLEPVRVGL